jgi:polysaccharide export outer membrane protein
LGRLVGAALVAGAMLGTAASAIAADYVLGAEDVIQISVWLHPELERTVSIATDGTITYPPIGSVQAAGLSPKQLGDRLGNQLSTFLRQTTAVTVTVTQFLSRSVWVSGGVARPGRYGFEQIPSLIDVISQAGGATVGAELSHVQVIHRDGENRTTVIADVASALRDGIGSPLPQLRPGDTVMVPGATLPGSTTPGDGVGVIGQVTKPGLYPVNGTGDVWSVIAAAGGLAQKGDLSNVSVVTRQGTGQVVVTLDLRNALRYGARAPFTVRNGDVVYVGSTQQTAAGKTWYGLEQVLGVSRDILNLLLIRDIARR